MDYESLLELVKKRKSIRRFKPEPIPDEYIDKIIEVARWAPSGANAQPWEFIIIKKEEIKRKIAQLLKEHHNLIYKMELTRESALRFAQQAKPVKRFAYEDAPVFIILCGDTRTNEAFPLYTLLQRGQSNFDSSLASTFLYMHLAATTLGLGSQWVSQIRNFFVQCLVKDLLGIPKELEIYDMMALGYPAAEPQPRLRRGKEEMVHQDYYDKTKFRTDEEIKEFITAIRKQRGAGASTGD